MAGTTNILGLIQRGEGNYNSVVGAVNSGLDLSQYSVSGVRAAFPTGALGAYQVTSGTWAAATRGIDPNAQFTPAVQDQMAINLLNARGFQDYQNGLISDSQMQLNLAKEWASIPGPAGSGFDPRSPYYGQVNDGTKSYYEGFNGNRANPRLGGDTLKQALANSKDLKAGDGVGQSGSGTSGSGQSVPPALAAEGYTYGGIDTDTKDTFYVSKDGNTSVMWDAQDQKWYNYDANTGNPVVIDQSGNVIPSSDPGYQAAVDASNAGDGSKTQTSDLPPPVAGIGGMGGGAAGGMGGAGSAAGAAANLAGGAGCLGGAGGLAGMLAGSAIGQAIGGLGQAAVMGAVNGLLSGGGIQGALSGALGGLGGALGNSIGAALGGAAGTLGNTLGGIVGKAIGGSLGAIASGQNPAQALTSSAFGALMSSGASLIPALSGVMPAGLAQAVVGGFAGVLGATAQGYPLSAAVRFGLSGGLGGMIANVSNNMTGAIAAGAIAANGVLNGSINLSGKVTVSGSVDLGRYASLIQMTAGVTAGNRLMVGAVTEAMSMKFGNGVGGQGAATRNMQDAMTFSVTTLGQNVNAVSADMIAMGKWDATNMMRFMQPGNIIAQLLIAGLGDIIGLTDIMLLNNVPVAGIDNPLYDRVSLAILTAINDKTAIGVVQSAFNMTTKIDNLGDLCLLKKMMPTSYSGMPVTNFREMGVHLAVMGVTQAATVYDIGVAFSQVETATDLNHISQLAQPLPASMGAALLQTYGYGGGSMGEQTMADFIGTPAGYVHADTAPVIAAALKYIESHSEAATLVLLTTMLNNLANGVYTDLGTAADSTATPAIPGEDPIITVPFPGGTLTFSTLDDAVMAFIPLMEAEQQKLLNTTDPKLLDWINKLNLAWSASCAQLVRENNNLLMHQIDIFNLPTSTPQTGMMFAQSLDYYGTQTGYGQPADYIERVASNDVYGDAVKYVMRQSRNAAALGNLGINIEKYKLPQSQYYREPENFY